MPKIDKVVYTNELNEIRTILKLVMFLNKYFNIVIDTNNTFNDMITKYPDIYNSIETINAEILRLDNKIDNHLSNYNELVNDVESNTNNINILQNRVDAQTQNIASLETKSNEQAQNISTLRNDLGDLGNDVSGKLDKTGGTLTGNLNIGQYSLQGNSNGAIKDLIHFGTNGALNLGTFDRVTNINSFGRPKWNNKLIAIMDDTFPKDYYLVGYSNFEGNASFVVVIPSKVEIVTIYDTFGSTFIPILNGIFTFNNNEYTVVGIKAIDLWNIQITYINGFDVFNRTIDFTNGDTSIVLLDY